MIWITQCLCEARHCILARAWDDATVTQAEGLLSVREQVAEMFRLKKIDPWCRICKSRKFHYESGRTKFKTMEEAAGPLAIFEASNKRTGDLLEKMNADIKH